MKLLVDMNLSPGLCEYLQEQGWEAVHWSAVGKASSPDGEILQYLKNGVTWSLLTTLISVQSFPQPVPVRQALSR